MSLQHQSKLAFSRESSDAEQMETKNEDRDKKRIKKNGEMEGTYGRLASLVDIRLQKESEISKKDAETMLYLINTRLVLVCRGLSHIGTRRLV